MKQGEWLPIAVRQDAIRRVEKLLRGAKQIGNFSRDQLSGKFEKFISYFMGKQTITHSRQQPLLTCDLTGIKFITVN